MKQVEATKRQEEAWRALIPQIETMELEGAGDGSDAGAGGAPDDLVGV